MKEVQIRCLTREFPVPDLGLHLQRGRDVYVSEEQADASKDLQAALQMGVVSTTHVERAQRVRKALVVSKKQQGPSVPLLAPPVRQEAPPQPLATPAFTPIDVGLVRRLVREELQAFQGRVQDLESRTGERLDGLESIVASMVKDAEVVEEPANTKTPPTRGRPKKEG